MRDRRLLLRSLGAVVILIMLAVMLPVGNVSSTSIYTGRGFPYRAFSDLPSTRFELNGGVLEVAFAPGTTSLPRGEVLGWAERSANSIVSYYGRLPTPTAKLLFVPVPGRRINGTTYGYGGAASRILLGAPWFSVHRWASGLDARGGCHLCRTDRAGADRFDSGRRNVASTGSWPAKGSTALR
jgi:hypothetical protein